MRGGTWMTGDKNTLLACSDATSRATNGKYLCWSERFLHGSEIMPELSAHDWSILNTFQVDARLGSQ